MKTEINQINENLRNIYSYYNPHLEVKLTNHKEELKKANNLRQRYYKLFQPRTFLTHNNHANKTHTRVQVEQKAVVYDGYDKFADHLIVIDHKADKVIAYVRLIDAYTAYKIGGYYSENHFNLKQLLHNNSSSLEMSRLVIDPEYNCKEIAELLWYGLVNYSVHNSIDSLIGAFSLSLIDGKETFSFIQHLKAKYISDSQYRVLPYRLFLDRKIEKVNDFNEPLIEYFFEKGSKICGDAHWNHDSNCAEIFIHCSLSNKDLFPNYNDLDLDKTDSGVNYIN